MKGKKTFSFATHYCAKFKGSDRCSQEKKYTAPLDKEIQGNHAKKPLKWEVLGIP